MCIILIFWEEFQLNALNQPFKSTICSYWWLRRVRVWVAILIHYHAILAYSVDRQFAQSRKPIQIIHIARMTIIIAMRIIVIRVVMVHRRDYFGELIEILRYATTIRVCTAKIVQAIHELHIGADRAAAAATIAVHAVQIDIHQRRRCEQLIGRLVAVQ